MGSQKTNIYKLGVRHGTADVFPVILELHFIIPIS